MLRRKSPAPRPVTPWLLSGLLACSFGSVSTLALTPGAWAGDSSKEWTRIGDEDGVELFKKEATGGILDFRGQGSIDAPPAKVISVILDTTRAKEWVADLEESRVVRWIDKPVEYIEYNHIGTPFVIKDRDFVSHVKVTRDPDGSALILYMAASSDELAPTKYVRGDITGSKFRLKPIDDGKRTWLEGEVHADPRGSVPKWIVNLFQKDWPVNTFRALRAQTAKTDVVAWPFYTEFFQKMAPANSSSH